MSFENRPPRRWYASERCPSCDASLLCVLLLALPLGTGCTSSGVVGQAPGGAEIVRIPLRLSNVHLVKSRTPILIDAGTLGDGNDLDKALEEYGVRPRTIGLVVVTHGHGDHAGLAADFQRTYGAKIMLGAGDVGSRARGTTIRSCRPASSRAS